MTELDDRLDARAQLADERWDAHTEKHQSEKELEGEKWSAHRAEHKAIAANLDAYKTEANEWRGTVTDLRSNFVTRAEHDLLATRILEFREELQKGLATEREERREQQNVSAGQRQGIQATTGTV